ncbi:MAG: hypothetical protein COW01_16435 [Bdellovibrionales bacterium CG12_big_fil_rev_8_21_14_0_65_38_15]|nr:MAG: hypothetical protein COW79_00475 [Bdellovibrionales bacterium CG22_combo_CG10-13_8_21_14_all_38_13]PIQ52290.1 MAG: hypothetical protein COW01_16435 [Bdellovibrionales bacterium CG12_big_fil_rev_8_21_14_0_65_38_15]PIR29819.1 MAG: hypothetical protein COV38_08900 [Bdellovibrionales bacterium CG11_big_fil_rev_8_21_14_0_20_38_13]
MMKNLIYLLLFILNVASAEDFRVGSVDENVLIETSQKDFLTTVKVVKNKKNLLSYQADLVTQKLLKSGLVKFKNKDQPFLVTVWTGGAHGQELIVFDLAKYNKSDKEAAIAYVYGSAWTIDMDINQERIVIKGNKEVDEKTNLPVKEELTFKP